MFILTNNRISILLSVILASISTLITEMPVKATSIFDNAVKTDKNLEKLLNVPVIAQSRYAFTVTGIYSGTRNIKLKSTATGNEFDVYYASSIGAEIGDVITVIIEDDRWITLINERTGKSSAVTSVTRI